MNACGRRLNEGCPNRFHLPVALAVVRNELRVGDNIVVKFANRLQQFSLFRCGRFDVEFCLQIVQDSQRFSGSAGPEIIKNLNATVGPVLPGGEPQPGLQRGPDSWR